MKPDITLKQYENIYQIVSALGKHFAHGAGSSCQFYNVNGAFILKQLLRVRARPVMGAAFIRLNENGDTAAFAGIENEQYYSSPDAFHCWIETPNFIIDFTAPEYKEAVKDTIDSSKIPRQMFQKEKTSMSSEPFSMAKTGDFFFEESPELTKYLLGNMMSLPATEDFANICCDWYKKLSKKGIDSTKIMNDLGELTPVQLTKSKLTSKW